LTNKYHELELNYDKLWTSTFTISKDAKATTSKGCERCSNVDIHACATNLDELAKKDKEIKRLNTIVKKVNNVATPTTPLVNNKNNKKKQVEVSKQQVPISCNHICDYMCCWDKDSKIVVKYVGALKKRQIFWSVWVPKSYVSNPLGSISRPKPKA
jgi:hypothetical protein